MKSIQLFWGKGCFGFVVVQVVCLIDLCLGRGKGGMKGGEEGVKVGGCRGDGSGNQGYSSFCFFSLFVMFGCSDFVGFICCEQLNVIQVVQSSFFLVVMVDVKGFERSFQCVFEEVLVVFFGMFVQVNLVI